jgi:hypothetical protein
MAEFEVEVTEGCRWVKVELDDDEVRTERGADGIGGERSGLLDRLLPQVDQAPGRLHRVAEHPVAAELGAEPGHPLPVGGDVNGLEIVREHEVAVGQPRRHAPQVVLGNARRQHRYLRGIDLGGEIPEELDIAIANDGVEDALGAALDDPTDDGGEIDLIEREILLAGDRHSLFREPLFRHEVRRPRGDDVGAEEEDLPSAPAGRAREPVDRREHLLVGDLASIDDMPRRFVPPVLHRVEEERVAGLEKRKERFSAGARPAAEEGDRPGIEELVCASREKIGSRAGVGAAGGHLLAEDPAGGVEPFHRMGLDIADRRRPDRQGAGLRVEEADRHLSGPRRNAEGATDKQRGREQPRGGERRCHPLPEHHAARGAAAGGANDRGFVPGFLRAGHTSSIRR